MPSEPLTSVVITLFFPLDSVDGHILCGLGGLSRGSPDSFFGAAFRSLPGCFCLSCGSSLPRFCFLCGLLDCWGFSSKFFLGRQGLFSDQVVSTNVRHVLLPRLHLILIANFVILGQLCVDLRCGTKTEHLYESYTTIAIKHNVEIVCECVYQPVSDGLTDSSRTPLGTSSLPG